MKISAKDNEIILSIPKKEIKSIIVYTLFGTMNIISILYVLLNFNFFILSLLSFKVDLDTLVGILCPTICIISLLYLTKNMKSKSRILILLFELLVVNTKYCFDSLHAVDNLLWGDMTVLVIVVAHIVFCIITLIVGFCVGKIKHIK